jgi:DNA-binding GntR family transcriptional regulator
MLGAAMLSNQDIYERIYTAISERRLLPGTKLSEEKLAGAFLASRTRIREVLNRLGQEGVIDLQLNRGAFVASPTPRDLRDVFALRRAIERAVAVQLCAQLGGAVGGAGSASALDGLRLHLEAEDQARRAGDRAALARLTGSFHLRLAEATENRLFADSLRRLVALTGLAIAQYDVQASSACPDHEHGDIVAAIEAGDARKAERLMLQHLDHVEQGIRPPTEAAGELDFKSIFGLEPATAPRPARPRRRRAG